MVLRLSLLLTLLSHLITAGSDETTSSALENQHRNKFYRVFSANTDSAPGSSSEEAKQKCLQDGGQLVSLDHREVTRSDNATHDVNESN